MKRPEETVLAGFFENPSIEAAREALLMVGSGGRLQILLRICDHFLEVGNAEGACSLFHESWTGCDNTWTYRHKIASLLRKLSSKLDPLDFLEGEDSAAFDALPESIHIFRGCSRQCVNGCAWTLDPSVAEGFAGAPGYQGERSGHRVAPDSEKSSIWILHRAQRKRDPGSSRFSSGSINRDQRPYFRWIDRLLNAEVEDSPNPLVKPRGTSVHGELF